MAPRKSDEESGGDAVARFASTPPLSALPSWYPEFLESVAEKVRAGRGRIAASANRELIATYWAIGCDIRDRQADEGWDAKVIDRLPADLEDRFPEAEGFSPRNLKYMRRFAQTWDRNSIVQAPLAQLPWYHQIALLEKLSDTHQRPWYAAHSEEEGWSRDCQWPIGTAQWRPPFLPVDGQQKCPVAASWFAREAGSRGWPPTRSSSVA